MIDYDSIAVETRWQLSKYLVFLRVKVRECFTINNDGVDNLEVRSEHTATKQELS